jgi:hypothetical protein
MPESIDQDKYLKNLISSLIDYAKANIGTSITVKSKSYTITYNYAFPYLTDALKDKMPYIVFNHISTTQDRDYGLGNYKTYMSTFRIYGFCSVSVDDEKLNEQVRVNLMSLIMKYFSDKYSIAYKEGTTVKGRLTSNCWARLLEPTSENLVDKFRFYADLNVKLAYLRS